MPTQLLFANFMSPYVSELDKGSIPILKGIKTTSRLAYKPDILPFCLKSEYIPDFIAQKKSENTWEQCCEQKVSEFEKIKGRLYLMWSGGIDSTNALVALLKYASEELKKRIVILMSTDSFQEFPEIFPLICRNFPTQSVYTEHETYLTPNDILLSGELGDQILGSDFIYTLGRYQGEEAIFKPYQERVPQLFKAIAGDKAGLNCYDHLEPIVTECPFTIKTCFDFFWWWNFTQKWQHVKYRVLFLNFMRPEAYSQNVRCFYDSPEFQWWSLTHHEQKIGSTLNTYKQVAKNFIVSETGLSLYHQKPKIGSLKNIRMLRPKKWALSEDFRFIGPSEVLKFPLK